MSKPNQTEKLREWATKNPHQWINTARLGEILNIKKSSIGITICCEAKNAKSLLQIDKEVRPDGMYYKFSPKQAIVCDNKTMCIPELPTDTKMVDLVRQIVVVVDLVSKRVDEHFRSINERLDRIEKKIPQKDIDFSRSIMVLQEEILGRLPNR